MAVAIVAAVATNGVIGAANAMPWRLRTDMQRFKRLTTGKAVVMGRKTYESIGKPLVDRVNIVVSRQEGFRPQGVEVVPTIDAALSLARGRAAEQDEVMVIGGGEIYRAAMPFADRLYITHVDAAPQGDTWFPHIEAGTWRAVSREPVPASERDSAPTTFVVYERVESAAGTG
jgi:dihydrofolate reductase